MKSPSDTIIPLREGRGDRGVWVEVLVMVVVGHDVPSSLRSCPMAIGLWGFDGSFRWMVGDFRGPPDTLLGGVVGPQQGVGMGGLCLWTGEKW